MAELIKIDRNGTQYFEGFTTHGGLIYYRANPCEWKTLSIDELEKIEVLES